MDVYKCDTNRRKQSTHDCCSPGGDDGVLGPEAMDGAVLHAEGDHAFTLAILHQEVQGKVLHKVAGVVTQGLEGESEGAGRRGGGGANIARKREREEKIL